jgi:hypothetical protein
MGEIRNAYKILFGKPEGKRPFRRPRRRWNANFKMDLTGRGFGVVGCIYIDQEKYQFWVLGVHCSTRLECQIRPAYSLSVNMKMLQIGALSKGGKYQYMSILKILLF